MANQVVSNTATSASQFFDTLQAQQQQAFQGNQGALQTLSQAWAPVAATGAIPYGYSAGLDSILQSNIISQGASDTANAISAAQLRAKQASGGANVLPTGAEEQIESMITAKGNQSTAQNLAQEKEAGYEQGEKNLTGLTQSELGIASAENETGLGEAATSAGTLGLNAGEAQWKENQSHGLLSSVLGGLSGVAKFIPGIGPGISAGLGGVAKGLGNG